MNIEDAVELNTAMIKTKNDNVKAYGNVEAYTEIDGVVSLQHCKQNMIVDLGAKALAHLVASGDATYKVSGFEFGTQGHDLVTPDVNTPVAPLREDTSLIDTSPFIKGFSNVPLEDYTYQPALTETRVRFTLVMEKSEGNDAGDPLLPKYYTEAALTTDTGIFARETFLPIIKHNGVKIIMRWTIVFI